MTLPLIYTFRHPFTEREVRDDVLVRLGIPKGFVVAELNQHDLDFLDSVNLYWFLDINPATSDSDFTPEHQESYFPDKPVLVSFPVWDSEKKQYNLSIFRWIRDSFTSFDGCPLYFGMTAGEGFFTFVAVPQETTLKGYESGKEMNIFEQLDLIAKEDDRVIDSKLVVRRSMSRGKFLNIPIPESREGIFKPPTSLTKEEFRKMMQKAVNAASQPLLPDGLELGDVQKAEHSYISQDAHIAEIRRRIDALEAERQRNSVPPSPVSDFLNSTPDSVWDKIRKKFLGDR